MECPFLYILVHVDSSYRGNPLTFIDIRKKEPISDPSGNPSNMFKERIF